MFNFFNSKIRRICILGNQHGLLQYLLLSSLEEIDKTYFLFNFGGIPDDVKNKFARKYSTIPKPSDKEWADTTVFNCVKLFFDYRIYYPFRFPFLLNSRLEYWGHDHVYNSHCFFRNHPFRLLEDGLLNYVPYKQYIPKQRFLNIKRLLASKNHGELLRYSGDEKKCIAVYLTGLSNKGEVLKDPKTKIKSFDEMWEDSNDEKRSFINDVFGITTKVIDDCSKYKSILLTEPLSEMGILSEEEKIGLYNDIIKRIGTIDIAIKPHPMEKTDYKYFFPNSTVLDIKAPMQLLSLNGIKFEAAYSIISTALFDFPYRIKVCCIGSEVHPKLLKKWPEGTSDKIIAKITNKNVEIINY